MSPLWARAPGKVNLALRLGPLRRDGRHELVTLIESVSLADTLQLAPGAPGAVEDVVLCPGVEGTNLAARALAGFRAATGWAGGPIVLRIDKRVPVSAGMGGGSGDAAATLRLAVAAAGLDPDLAARVTGELAPALGSDVPSQLRPGLVLATGGGEVVDPLPRLAPHGVLVVPSPEALSTAAVYREAERQGVGRPLEELEREHAMLRRALGPGGGRTLPLELLANDLEPVARTLAPSIEPALAAVGEQGAALAMVSGSGPTVIGLFPGEAGLAAAGRAAQVLGRRWPGTVVAEPVDADFAAVGGDGMGRVRDVGRDGMGRVSDVGRDGMTPGRDVGETT